METFTDFVITVYLIGWFAALMWVIEANKVSRRMRAPSIMGVRLLVDISLAGIAAAWPVVLLRLVVWRLAERMASKERALDD